LGLRDTAVADVKRILNDKSLGAGWDINIYDPLDGLPRAFVGFSNDVSFIVDPDTNDYVSAGEASVAVSLTDIHASTLSGIPDAVAETDQAPWIVEFADPEGTLHQWKVGKSSPDLTVNCLVLELEVYG
jgi:hypothetical protein